MFSVIWHAKTCFFTWFKKQNTILRIRHGHQGPTWIPGSDESGAPSNSETKSFVTRLKRPWFLQVAIIQCCSEVMAVLLLVEAINTENATFRHWRRVWLTPRFLQDLFTPCSSRVMVLLLPLDPINLDSATFHLWMRMWFTHRSVQVTNTQCFSEVMALLLRVDPMNAGSVTFHH